jgi:DNA helicase-2/ATP-dependent DNA helicase PcrA
MSIKRVIGPPGCGKTSELMSIMDDVVDKRGPAGVLFCSYTRAAVEEAARRIKTRFGVTRADMPNLGTMHSICWRAMQRSMGIDKDSIFDDAKATEMFSEIGARFDPAAPTDFGSLLSDWGGKSTAEGNALLAAAGRMAAKMCSARDALAGSPVGMRVSAERLEWFSGVFAEWKGKKGVVDFDDMIAWARDSEWSPGAGTVILDEAQDVTPAQAAVAKKWAGEADEAWFAFDEDQAIYEFSGADPSWILELSGEARRLTVSRRVPESVMLAAKQLISRNKRRIQKEWSSTGAPGAVTRYESPDDAGAIAARSSGTVYVLARCRHMLPRLAAQLIDAGEPFINLRGPSPYGESSAAVKTAYKLACGETVAGESMAKLVEEIPVGKMFERGKKGKAVAIFAKTLNAGLKMLKDLGGSDLLIEKLSDRKTCLEPMGRPEAVKRFYERMIERRGTAVLDEKPRVTLGTIHSVKGGEADVVILCPDTTKVIDDSRAEDPEPERRVWYVAMTRARSELRILSSSGNRIYEEIL